MSVQKVVSLARQRFLEGGIIDCLATFTLVCFVVGQQNTQQHVHEAKLLAAVRLCQASTETSHTIFSVVLT